MTKWLNKTLQFTKPAMQLISHHVRQCYSWNLHFEISPPGELVLQDKGRHRCKAQLQMHQIKVLG